MTGIDEALVHNVPLHGDVFRTIYRQTFVDRPAYGAVVHYDVALIHAFQSVSLMVCHLTVAQTEAHEAYYYVAGFDGEGVVSHADAVAGGCLSEDGHVTVLQLKLRGEVDSARHIEHDSSLA